MMNFLRMQTLRSLAGARGRLGRLGFLRESVFWIAALQIFDYRMAGSTEPDPLVGFLAIVVIWSWASALVRRGHDLGLPGWQTLTAVFVAAWLSLKLDPTTVGGIVAGGLPVLAAFFLPRYDLVNRYGERPESFRPFINFRAGRSSTSSPSR